jgi:hypothetical protein
MDTWTSPAQTHHLKRVAAVALTSLLVVASDAGAMKYVGLGEAIKTFVKDAKVFKITKTLSADQKSRLTADYGWKPSEEEFVFYEGREADGKTVAWVFVIAEAFNTCFHKYAVGISPTGAVMDSVVIELSCPRSFKINRKSFLQQFEGKKHDAALTTKLDIDGVAEATLSSEAASIAARKALSLHNLLVGPGEAVKLAANVKSARASGAAMIQKAIDTGETLAKDGGVAAAILEPEKK